jgi:hypothetical protein
MTCPMFCTERLAEFLDEFDPCLKGSGTDTWYMQVIARSNLSDKVAVVDSLPCVNPHDAWKRGHYREISRAFSDESRIATWHRIADERGLNRHASPEEYGRVKTHPRLRPRSRSWLFKEKLLRRVISLGSR